MDERGEARLTRVEEQVAELLQAEAERRGRAAADAALRRQVEDAVGKLHTVQLSLATLKGGGQVAGRGLAWGAGVVAAVTSSLLTAVVMWLLSH